jgi:cytochrome c oxidase assembly factor CtaG
LLGRLEHYFGNPAIAWPLGVGAMLVWHIPKLLNAALTSDALHIFQHLSFLITGTIYWWRRNIRLRKSREWKFFCHE